MGSRMETAPAKTKATTTRRKRSSTEASPDEDGDKRRGRPRVDKQDESAADRRRTQIRMAQRAYRQRKESTLEDLRKRVSDLTTTLELLNKHFLDFSTRFQASGLSAAQTAELENLELRFEALVKEARQPADDALSVGALAAAKTAAVVSMTENSMSAAGSNSELEAADLVPQVRNVPSWLDQSAVSSEANRPYPTISDLGLGYTLYDAEDAPALDLSMLTAKDIVPSLISHTQPSTSASPEKIIFNNVYFDDDYDPFPIPSQPSPPRTFSFQESTFARRLHRACLERAYQLLLDPDMRPATYERVFRLSLLGRSRAKILNIIKIVLARGPHQDLDFWEAPLIHVGGAGTHYPPRDAFGNILPKTQSRNIGRIGPQTLALLDNATREQISLDMTVEIAGYEGEWFDPNDVQGYLEERGVFIDPASTFAEADLVIQPEESSGTATSSSASALTPAAVMANSDNATADVSMLDTANAAATQWDDLFAGAEFTGVGFSDAQTGSFMNFLQPGEAIKRTYNNQTNANVGNVASTQWTNDWMDPMGDGQELSLVSMTPGRQQRTKKVVIDVPKLVKALATSGVCLGRSPGFRRKDVDHALNIASVEPF